MARDGTALAQRLCSGFLLPPCAPGQQLPHVAVALKMRHREGAAIPPPLCRQEADFPAGLDLKLNFNLLSSSKGSSVARRRCCHSLQTDLYCTRGQIHFLPGTQPSTKQKAQPTKNDHIPAGLGFLLCGGDGSSLSLLTPSRCGITPPTLGIFPLLPPQWVSQPAECGERALFRVRVLSPGHGDEGSVPIPASFPGHSSQPQN